MKKAFLNKRKSSSIICTVLKGVRIKQCKTNLITKLRFQTNFNFYHKFVDISNFVSIKKSKIFLNLVNIKHFI